MRDINKTKDELIRELVELRRKNAELKSMKPREETTKAQNALQLNEEHFRAIVENQVQFVDRYLPGGILTYVNSALARYAGVSPENLIGKSFFPFVHKDDLQELVRDLEALTPEKPFVKTENRVILPDGSVRWHRWVHQAFFDESGKVREYQSVGEDITDQRKAEESLRQSEKKFRTLAANFPDIIARFDRQLRHLYASPSVKKYTELPSENFLGKTNEELGMPAENVNIWNERLRQVFETGESEEFSFEFSSIGQSYCFSALLVPEFDETGAIESVLAIVRDITERKQVEEERSQNEEKYRQVINTSYDSIMLFDAETGHVMEANKTAEAIYGYSQEEFLNLKQMDLTAESEISALSLRQTVKDKFVYVSMRLHRKKNGAIFPVEIAASVFKYKDRQLICATVRDITERIGAEAKLRESEEKFRNLFNNSEIGMFRSRLDGSEVLDVNDKFLDIVGRTREEIEGRPSVILWADPKEREELFRKLVADGRVAEFEYKMLHKQLGVRNCITSLVLYREQGILDGSILDITERKKAEAKLIRINRLLGVLSHVNRAVAESNDRAQFFEDICRIAVERGKFRMAWIGLVNRDTGDINVASHFGHEDGYLSLVRITIDSNAPGGTGPTGTAIRENRYIINNNTEENTYMAHWRDEAIRRGYLSSAAFPIREHKQVIGALTVYISEPDYFEKDEIELAQEIVDGISFAVDGFDLKQQRKQGEEEKKRLEEQLHQSQKMESIGLLAGGVAHDFNNILSAIVGYGYMAQQTLKDDATTTGYIQEMLDSAHRAAELTQGLLAFSRKQVIKPALADLNEIVMNISRMLRRTIGEDIELNMELSAGKLSVMVDVGQIEQVLMNLATNARDAMPKGGRLGIKTDAVNVDSGYSEINYLYNAGMYAVLTVSDTGLGMDLGTQGNIFEPFFTTKEAGKGTGLGLSMVYGIIKQHNGDIRVHSETGEGTTFDIYLPMAEESGETIFEPKIETPPAGKGETIIVAEDEPQVRKSMRLILQGNGYKIIEAENGEDAIRKFQEHRSAVSLILLDVIMPVKNGREAYEKITGIEPSVKTIFMSGYTDDIITKKGLLEEGFDLISKPINPDALLRKIRDVLDR